MTTKLLGFVRQFKRYFFVILSGLLALTVYALLCMLINGETASGITTILVVMWFITGYLILVKQSKQLPVTFSEAGPLLLRAAIWPWHLLHNPDIDMSEKYNMIKLFIIFTLLVYVWQIIINVSEVSQLPPLVQEFDYLVNLIGLSYFVIWTFRSIISSEFLELLWGAIWRFTFLSLGEASLRYYAADANIALQWVHSNHEETLIAFIAAMFVYVLMSFAPKYKVRTVYCANEYAKMISRDVVLEPTDHDNLVTAAHEAGHAILCASLSPLPEDVSVVMRHQSDKLGWVTGVAPRDLLTFRSFSEWKMLLLLSGQIAEKVIYGDVSMGSSHDMTQWQKEAKTYLSNGFGAAYINSPENNLEVTQNQSTLQELCDKQRELLQQQFLENLTVLKEMADAIYQKTELTKEDLMPFLSRVQFVDDFPKPFTIQGIDRNAC